MRSAFGAPFPTDPPGGPEPGLKLGPGTPVDVCIMTLSVKGNRSRQASLTCLGRYTEHMIIPAGYAQVTFLHGGIALPFGAACTLGLDYAPALAVEDAAGIAAAQWNTFIRPLMVADVTFEGVLMKYGPNVDGPTAVVSVANPGGVSQDQLSPNTSVLIHKQTASGGRKNRGRMFVPGIGETSVDGSGAIAAGVRTTWEGAMEDLYDGLVAGGLQPVVLHGDATTPTVITSLAVDGRTATQRRRLRR